MGPNIRPDCLQNPMRKGGVTAGLAFLLSNRIMSGVFSLKSVANLKLRKTSQEKKNVKKAEVLRPARVQRELGTKSLLHSYLLNESINGYIDFCNFHLCAVTKQHWEKPIVKHRRVGD